MSSTLSFIVPEKVKPKKMGRIGRWGGNEGNGKNNVMNHVTELYSVLSPVITRHTSGRSVPPKASCLIYVNHTYI